MKLPVYRLRFLLFALIFFTSFSSYAQRTLIFDIHAAGMNIGTLTATQTQEGNRTIQRIKSEVDVTIVFKINVVYTSESVFENGVLIRSLAKSYKNGEVNSTVETILQAGIYHITVDGTESKIDRKITYNGSCLFFREPVGLNINYSETEGIDKPLTALGNHNYMIMNPETLRPSNFTYQNGQLIDVEMRHPWLSFTMKPRLVTPAGFYKE